MIEFWLDGRNKFGRFWCFIHHSSGVKGYNSSLFAFSHFICFTLILINFEQKMTSFLFPFCICTFIVSRLKTLWLIIRWFDCSQFCSSCCCCSSWCFCYSDFCWSHSGNFPPLVSNLVLEICVVVLVTHTLLFRIGPAIILVTLR